MWCSVGEVEYGSVVQRHSLVEPGKVEFGFSSVRW